MTTQRVIVYVDGFNLYFGLCERGWRKYLWLNIQNLSLLLLHENQHLEHVKYFTSRVRNNPEKVRRQSLFLDALATLDQFTIYYGKYLIDKKTCLYCGKTSLVPSEKMTDVNIAVELLGDAYKDEFDTAILISADSDLLGPLKAIRTLFPQKRLVVAFPPCRSSWALQNQAHGFFTIGESKFRKSQFPESFANLEGFVLKRPEEWK